jgi:hypothetical protein
MKRVIGIKRAGEVKAGEFVLVPQCGMGILLANEVTGTEQVDGGKWVEIATDDGLKHLVGKGDLVAVVF